MIREIADAAVSSLLQEVSTTPKPGLVDLNGNGAHTDMNFGTFVRSAASLSPYFHQAAETGAVWNNTLPELFTVLRELGKSAEQEMFAATGGVNTHRGLIFSEGILTAAASYAWNTYRTVCTDTIFDISARMTTDAIRNDFCTVKNTEPKTHGEKLFIQYGCRGIRGEVQAGFPSIRMLSLPALSSYAADGRDTNLSRVQTLMILMAAVDDTNVLYRGGSEALAFVKRSARRALDLGGAFTKSGFDFIIALDDLFVTKNISPGGCADLLAITILMHSLSRIKKDKTSSDVADYMNRSIIWRSS